MVVGLLCDEGGDPVAIEVFRGNTRDFKTFGSQVEKVARRFGCKRVSFVGDRGMIKSGQIKELRKAGFYYITAITKPEIEKLLRRGIFQMELFDKDVCELWHEGVRYILRRNEMRAEEIACVREEEKKAVEQLFEKKNVYLTKHPRTKVSTVVNEVNKKIKDLKIDRWLRVEVEGRGVEAGRR